MIEVLFPAIVDGTPPTPPGDVRDAEVGEVLAAWRAAQ
jgi:hypothetical protein